MPIIKERRTSSQRVGQQILVAALAHGLAIVGASALCAEEPAQKSSLAPPPKTESPKQPWLQAIPVPSDPELEHQIVEVQDALKTINEQIVRRKETVERTQDSAAQTTLYKELELLRKERNSLEALLHDLVDEAKLSEQTAIDQALARARSLERQRELYQQREEVIRERR